MKIHEISKNKKTGYIFILLETKMCQELCISKNKKNDSLKIDKIYGVFLGVFLWEIKIKF